MIEPSAFFHVTLHMEWFCEYETYDGGDDSTTKIIGHGRVKLLLKDGMIKTLLGLLDISDLAKKLIFVKKMSDACVHTIFKKERCKMV